jgi:hypothetical protein
MIDGDALARKKVLLLESTFFGKNRRTDRGLRWPTVGLAILTRGALRMRAIGGRSLETRPTEGSTAEQVLYSSKIEMTKAEMPAKKLLLSGRHILVGFGCDAKIQLGEASLSDGATHNTEKGKVGPWVERACDSGAIVRHGQAPGPTINKETASGRRRLLIAVLRAKEAAAS